MQLYSAYTDTQSYVAGNFHETCHKVIIHKCRRGVGGTYVFTAIITLSCKFSSENCYRTKADRPECIPR